MRDAIVFQSFQRFYVDGRKKNSNTLRVDRVLLLITLKAMKNIQRANATAYGSQMNLPKQKNYGTYQPGVFPKVLNNSSA